ncbi:hypothetical protein PPERSA_00389 [Pseudocohnilembus persalinus]|uniref:Uncharacterized protein n=1 Tax=Pseudocohnilembus persalinus TaxID=266149 RepID=A0A0V0QYW2_PSEPJ|nr:hypothetical protein PPERSA_00389 [Pseudocohnilembus persalinus]|eukprot:KRX07232.1 hypothetical protein PPERSA_00389 [Pseudocohnilembus persalinus]
MSKIQNKFEQKHINFDANYNLDPNFFQSFQKIQKQTVQQKDIHFLKNFLKNYKQLNKNLLKKEELEQELDQTKQEFGETKEKVTFLQYENQLLEKNLDNFEKQSLKIEKKYKQQQQELVEKTQKIINLEQRLQFLHDSLAQKEQTIQQNDLKIEKLNQNLASEKQITYSKELKIQYLQQLSEKLSQNTSFYSNNYLQNPQNNSNLFVNNQKLPHSSEKKQKTQKNQKKTSLDVISNIKTDQNTQNLDKNYYSKNQNHLFSQNIQNKEKDIDFAQSPLNLQLDQTNDKNMIKSPEFHLTIQENTSQEQNYDITKINDNIQNNNNKNIDNIQNIKIHDFEDQLDLDPNQNLLESDSTLLSHSKTQIIENFQPQQQNQVKKIDEFENKSPSSYQRNKQSENPKNSLKFDFTNNKLFQQILQEQELEQFKQLENQSKIKNNDKSKQQQIETPREITQSSHQNFQNQLNLIKSSQNSNLNNNLNSPNNFNFTTSRKNQKQLNLHNFPNNSEILIKQQKLYNLNSFRDNQPSLENLQNNSKSMIYQKQNDEQEISDNDSHNQIEKVLKFEENYQKSIQKEISLKDHISPRNIEFFTQQNTFTQNFNTQTDQTQNESENEIFNKRNSLQTIKKPENTKKFPSFSLQKDKNLDPFFFQPNQDMNQNDQINKNQQQYQQQQISNKKNLNLQKLQLSLKKEQKIQNPQQQLKVQTSNFYMQQNLDKNNKNDFNNYQINNNNEQNDKIMKKLNQNISQLEQLKNDASMLLEGVTADNQSYLNLQNISQSSSYYKDN